MEIDISLQEYLDKVKSEFKLDDSMNYRKVLSFLKKEVSFRETLINSVFDKANKLSVLVGDKSYDDYLKNLKISGLDNFVVKFDLGDSVELKMFQDIINLKLHYIFNVDFYTNFGNIILGLTLNHNKLKAIKRYI